MADSSQQAEQVLADVLKATQAAAKCLTENIESRSTPTDPTGHRTGAAKHIIEHAAPLIEQLRLAVSSTRATPVP